MEKYKILYHIVCLVVLSFHIRESQSRSLNDNESEHKITEKSGNIEDWKTECACFPITVKGTPISKFLPFNDEHDRLVVYFYKNKKTGELSSYTPSWKKQINFPDLTFDTGDKLQTVPYDGIINLFDTIKVPNRVKVTAVENIDPLNNEYELSIPTPDNQHVNINGASPEGLDQFAIVIPPEELAVYYVPPDSDYHTIINDVNPSQDLNLSLGHKQQPLNGTFFEPNQNLKPLEIQNQTPVISDNLISHLLPGKPGTEGQIIIINEPDQKPLVIQNQPITDDLTPHIIPGILPGKPRKVGGKIITNSPEIPIQPILNEQQEKKIYSPLLRPNPLLNAMLHVPNHNLNVPIDASQGFKELVKYLPGYRSLVAPSKLYHVISPNWINTTHLNKQNNLVNKGYLPSKYENPTFNDWFNKQMINIRSQRPYMSNVINYHVLKLLLIKALYDNGIHFSENGDLLDSNENILKMSNMKLRPIVLGDPMDYEKLLAIKKCVIPYDLPYLEAILLTLIYPPKILAIIPLSLGNPFISKTPGSLENYRTSLPEKEKTTNDIDDNVYKEDNDKDPYIHEEEPEEVAEVNEPKFSYNKESKNAYSYVGSTVDSSLQPNYNDQKSLLLTLTPNDPGISDGQIYDLIHKEIKNKCGHKHCPINSSFRSGFPEKEEPTTLVSDFNVNKANEESNDIAEKSDEYKTIEKKVDHMAVNDDLPTKTSLQSKSGSPDPEIYGGEITNDFVPEGSEGKCLNCRRNPNFLSNLLETEKPKYYLNTISDSEDNDVNLQTTEERTEELSKYNGQIYYSNDLLPMQIKDEDDNLNNLLLTRTPSEPGHIWTQPIFSRELIYSDEEGNIQDRKSEDFDDSQETPEEKLNEEDYEMLHIKIIGGNPATSSGTPLKSRGRSGIDY